MTSLHSPAMHAKRDLWLRLRRYHFDSLVPPHLLDHVASVFGGHDASTKAFAAKVARKAGWTRGFALRAVDEYRKFVYLGCISTDAVTPPKVIDQVWHEHLLFSRAYRDFCRDVLHQDFDHHPELLPVDVQTDVFQAQYEATLERYATEFHMTPPADIWGTPKFARDNTAHGAQPWSEEASTVATRDDAPLYLLFDGSGGGGESHATMAEFGGGGGFSGGGGGSSWGGGDSDGGSASDAGSAGGDCGDSGSGCSSSCGGGGE